MRFALAQGVFAGLPTVFRIAAEARAGFTHQLDVAVGFLSAHLMV